VVGMIRYDGDNVRIELASAPAPEEVQEAVVIARDKQRRALTFARVREAPSHPEWPADPFGEGAFELLPPILQRFEPELHSHEEVPALGVGRMLVGAEDVGVALEEEAGDCRDNPVPVGTPNDEPSDVLALVHPQNPCFAGTDAGRR